MPLTHTMHSFSSFKAQARDRIETNTSGALALLGVVGVAKLSFELSPIMAKSSINGSASGLQVVATPADSRDPTYVVLIRPRHPSCR